MERREFIKNSLLATGGLVIGGATVFRYVKGQESIKDQQPTQDYAIEKIHQGTGKNVLVLMSAGTRQGNTDRLTDAYIKGLVEKDHTVTKAYLGSMRLAGCRGVWSLSKERKSVCRTGWYAANLPSVCRV